MVLKKVLIAFRRICYGVLLCSLTVAVQSQSLTLADYVTDVISQHPQVLEQVHVFRQARQEQTIASSGWRPSVDFSATANRIESDSPEVIGTALPNDFNSRRYEVSITQNLFNGYDTDNHMKQAEAHIRSALFELYDTTDNIALDAVQAYLEVLKHTRLLELAKENVASHEETLQKIRRRSQSGAGRRSQLEQTEGRTARARAGLIAQQNNLEDALTEAHRLLGRYIQSSQLTEPTLPKRPGSNLAVLTDQALLQHPAVKVAQFNIEAARYDHHRSDSNRYPKIDLKLARISGDNLNGIPGDSEDTTLTLSFKYNLYNGGIDSANSQKKISVVHEQQQFSARVRRQVINTMRLAWMADQSLNEQIKFLQQHVLQSQKTVISFREEFFIGQRDLVDLLDAKNELNSAQNSYTNAYYDSLAARYRIMEGAGQLFESLNIEPRIESDNLVVARVKTQHEDRLPINQDMDGDNKIDHSDQCDNSLPNSTVDAQGCLK